MLGWFSDNTNIFVMLEECLGGELWELIKTVGCPVPRARYYLAQLINAVTYLRDARIWVQWFRHKNGFVWKLWSKKPNWIVSPCLYIHVFYHFQTNLFLFSIPQETAMLRGWGWAAHYHWHIIFGPVHSHWMKGHFTGTSHFNGQKTMAFL